ncbi:PglL family O-oligosaccharyltransferase [Rhodoferax fermentans]|nr:O-antigen ligase family protein [Rhodoferax fermentans]
MAPHFYLSNMNPIISRFWLAFAAVALSLAWILPNHSIPWLGFHGDAWCSTILLIVSIFIFARKNFEMQWSIASATCLFIATIPALQYIFNLIPIFGVAWINATYIFGFSLAILTGAAWEKTTPNQVGDYLFLSIGIASAISIGLQLHQFFRLDSIGPWILMSSGTRHYANMAQPNQLASLLLLGTLACWWGFWRKLIGPYTALLIAALFLFGTALTESRTAWLNVMLIVVASLIWHKLIPSKSFIYGILGLSIFFAVCVLNLTTINEALGGGLPVEYRSASNDPRWAAWVMFLKAAVHEPFFGFGWGQLGHAQFLMMDEKISFGGSFLQAHNLFIDLILWNGIPLGLGISIFLIWWFLSTAKNLTNLAQLMSFLFLMVLGVHSMLEYPLQYAYFLLPAGMIMGSLETSLNHKSIRISHKFPIIVVLILGICALPITIRDYFRVEDSFYGLRFEQKKIASDYPKTPPDVIALTQWRDYIIFARMEPTPNINPDRIAWMKNLVSTVPSAYGMYKLASFLAVNDSPLEASQWLRRLCQTSPSDQCEIIRNEWASQSEMNSKIGGIPWPNK